MPLVKNPLVTDSVLISELTRKGIAQDEVEFSLDYGLKGSAEHASPFAKNYVNLKTKEQYAVFSGLPMCNHKGQLLTPSFEADGSGYRSVLNTFDCLVELDGRVTVGLLNNQPDGKKLGKIARWQPTLYLNGKAVRCGKAVLHDIDPVNENYTRNVIEWDYGICKRRIRQIEGKCLGSWVFPADPSGDVRIVYNQSGDFPVRLGQYATSPNEETVPAIVFKLNRVWPFEVGDTLTVYPDAHPETESVDGFMVHQPASPASQATIEAGAGTSAADYGTQLYMYWSLYPDEINILNLTRSGVLTDTSSLGAGATITDAVDSLYGIGRFNQNGNTPTINLFSFAPASNTAIAAGDYDSLGSTAYATAISYASWSTAGYNNFTRNATGISAISKTGITKTGIREATFDAGSSTLTIGAEEYAVGFQSYAAEQGTGYKPKLVVTYTSGTTYTRTATVLTGNKVSSSRTLTAVRSRTVLTGNKTTASRAIVINRSRTILTGNKVTASRIGTFTRSAFANTGNKITASRVAAFVRSTMTNTGNKVTASRVWTITRSAVVNTGNLITAIFGLPHVYNFVANILTGNKTSASRTLTANRAATINTGAKITASRSAEFNRTGQFQTGNKITASRAWTITRSAVVKTGNFISAIRTHILLVLGIGTATNSIATATSASNSHTGSTHTATNSLASTTHTAVNSTTQATSAANSLTSSTHTATNSEE